MSSIKEIGEKKAKLWSQMKELHELTVVEKRSMTAEEEQTWQTMNADLEKLEDEERNLQRAEERSSFLAEKERQLNAPKGRKTEPDKPENETQKEERSNQQTEAEKRKAEYRSQFNRWTKCEIPTSEFESICERRNLQVDLPQVGGYITMPEQMVNQLLKFVDDMVFIRQRATKYSIPMAQSLGVPTLENDPSDADWTGELLTGSEDTTMSFGKRQLTPHPIAKRIRVSRTLLRMATIGAESLINERLAYKFAVTEEKAFLTGDGAGKPLGVFTVSDNGIPASRDVSTDNTQTAITADGLINAKFELKSQYQNSASAAWAFSRAAVRNIRKLKDGNGQYLWNPGLAGTPSTILDIPYFMSEFVPSTFTTGQYVGVLGDWRFYWIADSLSMGVQRLEELYAATNQVGFIGRRELDAMPVLAEAFVRVKLA